MKQNIFTLLLLALLGLTKPAAAASPGADPFNFLLLDANARAAGMGGAYTALANDANALLYNPAGLGRISAHEATFMHNEHFQGVKQEYLAFSARQGFGLSLNRKRHMDGHLISVEISIKGRANQWVKLNGLSFNQNRLEGLNTQPM